MNTLATTIAQHFRDYITTHCPKLLGDKVYADGGLWFQSTNNEVSGSVWFDHLDQEVSASVVLSRAEFIRLGGFVANNTPECRLRSSIADPDSLGRIERLLQKLNDQLP